MYSLITIERWNAFTMVKQYSVAPEINIDLYHCISFMPFKVLYRYSVLMSQKRILPFEQLIFTLCTIGHYSGTLCDRWLVYSIFWWLKGFCLYSWQKLDNYQKTATVLGTAWSQQWPKKIVLWVLWEALYTWSSIYNWHHIASVQV